ncbi:MAG TPA: hypothetical protein VMJ11_16025 [Paraburkholderia sp.]|nr:hypothetical protein [Paraburkholderia sp.]HTR08123.1 hypothetical protein [Paraburkholderia sp.]
MVSNDAVTARPGRPPACPHYRASISFLKSRFHQRNQTGSGTLKNHSKIQ